MPAGRPPGGLSRAASDRHTLQPRGVRGQNAEAWPEVARPNQPGQGASFQREGDPPPRFRPRDPSPFDAGPAPAAGKAGPASSRCARCAALQPPRAAWACVLRLLPGRRARSKIRVLIRWRPAPLSAAPVWSDCDFLGVCLDPLGLRSVLRK